MSLIEEYEEMISDYNVKELLQSDLEFDNFINIPCTKEDLLCFLKVCENNELFEWCSKIKNKIYEI